MQFIFFIEYERWKKCSNKKVLMRFFIVIFNSNLLNCLSINDMLMIVKVYCNIIFITSYNKKRKNYLK